MTKHTVYILTNWGRSVLYTGVTNDLQRRLMEHQAAGFKSFSGRYKTHFLLYYEEYASVVSAIAREKEIKNMSHEDKVVLIQSINPSMRFLNI